MSYYTFDKCLFKLVGPLGQSTSAWSMFWRGRCLDVVDFWGTSLNVARKVVENRYAYAAFESSNFQLQNHIGIILIQMTFFQIFTPKGRQSHNRDILVEIL